MKLYTTPIGYENLKHLGKSTDVVPPAYRTISNPEVLLVDYEDGTKLFILEDKKYRPGTQKEFAEILNVIRYRFKGELSNVPKPEVAALPSTSERVQARLERGETIFAPEFDGEEAGWDGDTEIAQYEGELYVKSYSEGGYRHTLVNITTVLDWVSKNAPDLLAPHVPGNSNNHP